MAGPRRMQQAPAPLATRSSTTTTGLTRTPWARPDWPAVRREPPDIAGDASEGRDAPSVPAVLADRVAWRRDHRESGLAVGCGPLLLGAAPGRLRDRDLGFIDAIIRPSAAFPAAGKQTKPLWLVILGVAFVIGIGGAVANVSLISVFPIVAFVAASIYLVDVRPKVKSIKSGSASRQGPYGPW